MFHLLIIIAHYLYYTLLDGDYLNDWLSHLDHESAAIWEAIGHAIARLIGG